MNTKSHTDIKSDHWAGAILPQALQPYVFLSRLDRPIGIWLLLLPGWWSVVLASGGPAKMNGPDWYIFFLFGIGAVVMRAAGCVINDLWDRDLDKQVERTRLRPLAAGTVSVRQAFVFLVLLLFTGLLVLLQMNMVTVFLGILALPLIVAYPLMKRVTWWPQAFLGITFNFGALMGWSAVTGVIDQPALLLYAGGIFWTLGYDTVYAHQDKEDDALLGVRSTALKLGDSSKKWVAGFYALAWMCIAWGSTLAQPQGYMPHFLLPAAAHLFLQLRRWDVNDPQSSLRAFKASRNFGLLVLLGVVLGTFQAF